MQIDVRVAKAQILRCLTEDFSYGKTKGGAPLKRPKINQAIFDAYGGWACFTGTDLTMVMDKVVLGLHFALAESTARPPVPLPARRAHVPATTPEAAGRPPRPGRGGKGR